MQSLWKERQIVFRREEKQETKTQENKQCLTKGAEWSTKEAEKTQRDFEVSCCEAPRLGAGTGSPLFTAAGLGL